MSNDVLESIYQIIKAQPHSGQSLLLFALLKTLDVQQGGHMYLLGKLKELTPENRQLAYAVMEMMASNKIYDENWQTKLQLIEAAIRGNQ
jgi:hypothetical protein